MAMLSTAAAGRRTTCPPTLRSRAVATSPPSRSATSVLVPPMSNETARSIRSRRASRADAATPAAGPDITVASGSARTAATGTMLPEESTTKSRAAGT